MTIYMTRKEFDEWQARLEERGWKPIDPPRQPKKLPTEEEMSKFGVTIKIIDKVDSGPLSAPSTDI